MNLKFTTADKRMQVELEGDQKSIFKELSSFQEVFDNLTCGKCESNNIRFTVRKAQDGKKTYEYPELHCLACNARLKFGSLEDGSGLFPKRKDSDGNYLPTKGWVKWDKEAGKDV